jgi:ssDNA-binding Zn-finger/Zn-ribbon topoisomerase 1
LEGVLVADKTKQHEESAELMYVKCAYCGKWMDVKPGNMTWVSHSLCEECLAKEMKKLEALKKPPQEP